MAGQDHTLEYLLAYNGFVILFENDYWVKFEIKRIKATKNHPHGLKYSFTLHDPANKRVIGFDNAHQVKAAGRSQWSGVDHRHQTETDKGIPYRFVDSETLLVDFNKEIDRVFAARGLVRVEVQIEKGKP